MKSKVSFTALYKKGLGRSLLLILLVSTLLPMIVVSLLHYQNSKKELLQSTQHALEQVTDAEAAKLSSYFDGKITSLTMLSEMQENVNFLEALKSSFVKSNQRLDEFIMSYTWAALAEQGSDLALFRRTYGIYDIFIMDTEGNILFSVARENDLGTNLFLGDHAESGFASACRFTDKTGKLAFADYDTYAISDPTTPYAFLSVPIINEEGERRGIMAFQLIGKDIDILLNTSLGERGEVYLISEGGRRSSCRLDPSMKFLDVMEETEQVIRWRGEHLKNDLLSSDEHLRMNEETYAYRGPHGKDVFGIHRAIMVGDTHFALIAEVEQQQALALVTKLRDSVLLLALGSGLMAIALVSLYIRTLVQPILQLVQLTKKVAAGDFSQGEQISAKYELAELALNFQTMQSSLKEKVKRERRDNWQKNALAGLNDTVRGEQELSEMAIRITSFMVSFLKAQVGAFYIKEKDVFIYRGGYACRMQDVEKAHYGTGEGLVGQAAQQKKTIHFTELPAGHLPLTVSSGLGATPSAAILAVPLLYEDRVLGVVELGRISSFATAEITFLETMATTIGIVLNSAISRSRTNDLLAETQRQSHELQNQQEELKSSNEELEEQTAELRRSQHQLQEQSEELKASNEELEEKSERLQAQKIQISKAKEAVDQKARELAAASQYKSEFLANMSHELRSPLNSLLILARGLADNDEGNLSSEQIEEAGIIHNSGTELLHLINDILDLSKVEAGQLDIHTDAISLEPFCQSMTSSFGPLAKEKMVDFRVECDQSLPAVLVSDEQRLAQILKNLISNALKFTAEGEVVLAVHLTTGDSIAFAVRDTGIGIPPKKQQAIFQAFQQADGSTTRNYGGTGLGLTISRKLAGLLEGTITVDSVEGQGATFTLIIPAKTTEQRKGSVEKSKPRQQSSTIPLPDQLPNEQIAETLTGKTILVVDDDMRNTFAMGTLLKKTGMTVILAADGEQALERLKESPGIDLVLMDMMMPVMDGYEATARIRTMDDYKDLPVIAITAKAMSDDREKCLSAGVNAYLAKPVDQNELFKKMSLLFDTKQTVSTSSAEEKPDA